MDINQRNPAPNYRGTPRKRSRIILILLVAIIILFIARQELPIVRDTIDQIIAPARYQAGKTCHQRAMQLGRNPAFARIIQPGQVTETQQGYLVDKIIVGEMGEDGHEVQLTVTCYTDSNGKLVRAELVGN